MTTWINESMKGDIHRASEGHGTHDVVIGGIEMLQKAGGAPTGAEHDDGLLRRVVGELCAWVLVRLGDVVEDAGGGEDGEEGDATEGLEEFAPAGDVLRRRSGGRSVLMERLRRRKRAYGGNGRGEDAIGEDHGDGRARAECARETRRGERPVHGG